MKKLIIALLLFPIFSFAQAVPEKANLITVSNTETAYANFTDVRLLLNKKGIEIANLDKESFEVKSGLIEVKGASYSYYIFTCRDNKITITGKNKNGDVFETIANEGSKDSPTKLLFNAMNEFAKLLGSKLKYEITK